MSRVFCIFFLTIIVFSIDKETDNYITGGYYKNIYKADSLFLIGQISKAHDILEYTFNHFKPINLPYYEEYKIFVKTKHLIGQKSEAGNALDKLIAEYGITWSKINQDYVLKEIVDHNKYSKSKYDILRFQYEKSTLPSLKKELDKMYLADQNYRKKYMNTSHLNKIDSIDKLHSIRLVEIFEVHGYPMPNLLGLSSSHENFDRKISTLLLHTKASIRNDFFLPIIKKSIENGKCDPLIYGFLVDQLLVYNERPQKFGTYNTRKEIIKDSLNKYRQKIGLPNYGYEKWRRSQLY